MLASLQLLESIFAGVSSAAGFHDKATVFAVAGVPPVACVPAGADR